MAALVEQSAGWLEIGEKSVNECCKSDDCLDALICALNARAVELGLVIPVADHARAVDEGWIALPLRGPVSNLSIGL